MGNSGGTAKQKQDQAMGWASDVGMYFIGHPEHPVLAGTPEQFTKAINKALAEGIRQAAHHVEDQVKYVPKEEIRNSLVIQLLLMAADREY